MVALQYTITGQIEGLSFQALYHNRSDTDSCCKHSVSFLQASPHHSNHILCFFLQYMVPIYA